MVNKTIRQEFGERIKELRDKKGLTREELSAQAGILLSVIIRSESGKGYGKLENIFAFMDFFGVTAEYLLRGR